MTANQIKKSADGWRSYLGKKLAYGIRPECGRPAIGVFTRWDDSKPRQIVEVVFVLRQIHSRRLDAARPSGVTECTERRVLTACERLAADAGIPVTWILGEPTPIAAAVCASPGCDAPVSARHAGGQCEACLRKIGRDLDAAADAAAFTKAYTARERTPHERYGFDYPHER